MVRAAVSTSLFVNLADGIQGTCLAAGVALNLRCFSVGLGTCQHEVVYKNDVTI